LPIQEIITTGGPLEYLEEAIKDNANKANKDPNSFKVILLTYPNIIDSKNQPTNAYRTIDII
jgi:hypothetical protein